MSKKTTFTFYFQPKMYQVLIKTIHGHINHIATFRIYADGLMFARLYRLRLRQLGVFLVDQGAKIIYWCSNPLEAHQLIQVGYLHLDNQAHFDGPINPDIDSDAETEIVVTDNQEGTIDNPIEIED